MTARSANDGPVVLVILDGWGIGRDEPGNAVLAAETPTMDRLVATYPQATLRCSGEDVGLPAGQMGNSEVGHLNLGAGFIVYQWLTRIDKAIADGEFFQNQRLAEIGARLAERGGTLHLLGLVSDGGVHSHLRHLDALIDWAKDHGVDELAVHAVTDGRDTSPTSGLGHIEHVERKLAEAGIGRIASVTGRYYAMDRDKRWDRTQRAFNAIVRGEGERAESATQAVRDRYDAGITDEFIPPTVIAAANQPPAAISPGDALICVNFRADRMRQIVAAIASPDFDGFPRDFPIDDLLAATMARYEVGLPVQVLFESQDVEFPVARIVSDAGMAQFHCAETEKYAHVTFFFNGGREEPFPSEARDLIPSPKVATYDLQPAMSAEGVAGAVVAAIERGRDPFVIVNFANCDMVGHTGVFEAAVRAVETVDRCLERVVEATLARGGVAIVTADHGNAEEMIDRATGQPMTAHTTNPVPVVIVAPDDHPHRATPLRRDCRLASVAPTVLKLLGIDAAAAMTEPSLLDR